MSTRAAAITALRQLADALEAQGVICNVDVNDRVIAASVDEVRDLLDALCPQRMAPRRAAR